MRSVYRYDVAISGQPTRLALPIGSRVLHAGVAASTARDCLSLWVEVLPESAHVDRSFVVHGTGHDIENPAEVYVGTVVDPRYQGVVVWHVYEVHS